VTEAEWLACESPLAMLFSLGERASKRKVRLFATACCRRAWHLMTDERSRDAVEVAERFADGLASPAERKAAQEAAHAAMCGVGFGSPLDPVYVAAQSSASAAWAAARRPGAKGANIHAACEAGNAVCYALGEAIGTCQLNEQPAHVALIRDLFGGPFSPVCVDPVWLTPAVTALATVAFEERSLPSGHIGPARLAVLADALEEAGCADAELLGHLRAPGPHVRGCWALDLILGKG
jgi:hypothetical protein